MRRTTTLVAALLAILLGSFAVDSSAQGVQTGSIRGTVSDQQNLPVPGVTVTIQSPALQGVRSTVSAGDGTYSFLRLPPGRYEMTFEITSFAPVKRTVDVLLGLSAEQNVALAAAGRTEEVQVVAATPAPIVNPIVGANYYRFRPTDVQRSMIHLRMAIRDASIGGSSTDQMPPLVTLQVDTAGLALVDAWIAAMTGTSSSGTTYPSPAAP